MCIYIYIYIYVYTDYTAIANINIIYIYIYIYVYMHVKSGVAQPEDAGRLSLLGVWMNIVEKGTEQRHCACANLHRGTYRKT